MIGLRDRVGLAALSFSLVLLPAAAPQSTPQSSDGLYFSNFETPEGKVTVILPADLRAGDTLSGTVWADEVRPSSGAPGGGARLSGYVLEVDDQKVDPSAATFTHTVPQGASKPVTVRLLSPQGRALGEAFLPLVRPVPEPPSVDRFTAPSLVQAGQPIQIKGPFSGDLAASRLSVGGTAARPLAQSPRNGWWQVPPEVTGPADVELVQDGTTHEGETRSVGVQPSADRLNLQRGETSRMRIHVSGLEGLEQPIPLALSNETPSVVSLEGGDSQTVTIPPSEVSPDGTWQGTRTVTGRVRGSYNLRVRVVPDSLWPWLTLPRLEPPPVPIQQPAQCACESVDFAAKNQRRAGTRPVRGGEHELKVDVSIDSFITCTPGRGNNCKATVTPRVEGNRTWRYFDANGDAKSAEEQPQSVQIDAKEQELRGSCKLRESNRKASRDIPVSFQVNLKPSIPIASPAFLGELKVTLAADCGDPQHLTLQVDTAKSDTGIQELLSDLDGDGVPGFRDRDDSAPPATTEESGECKCKEATLDLKADEGTVTVTNVGSYTVLELTLPWSSTIECDGSRRGECHAVFKPQGSFFAVGQNGQRVNGQALLLGVRGEPAGRLVPVAPAKEGAADVVLTGSCSGSQPKKPEGTLVYRAFFLSRRDPAGVETQLGALSGAQGGLDLDLTCAGCSEARVEKFTVAFDPQGRVTVRRR